MKKLVCLFLILCLFPVFSLADDTSTFIAKWNVYSKHYGADKLSNDMLNDGVFSDGHWKMTVDFFMDTYKGVGIYAEDADTLLSMAAQAGVILVGQYDSSSLRTYLGDLAYMYFSAKVGEDFLPSVFGSYTFSITKSGNGYMFTMMGL